MYYTRGTRTISLRYLQGICNKLLSQLLSFPHGNTMSTLEKAHPVEQTNASDGGHKFHLEFSDTQIRNAEYAAGAAVGAAALGVIALRTGKLALLEESMPSLETAVNSIRADFLRLTNSAPKQNFYQLKNGLELQFSHNAKVYGKINDIISVSHTLGEAHLLRDGSRIVAKYGIPNFYDEAGKGLHMSLPSREMPSMLFQNQELTPINKKAFRMIENCFLTGSTKSLERMPNLFEQVSKF
jgi:hypothetical protein